MTSTKGDVCCLGLEMGRGEGGEALGELSHKHSGVGPQDLQKKLDAPYPGRV